MAGQKPLSPMGCYPPWRRCARWAIWPAAKWAADSTIALKILTCHFVDENGRCCDFAIHRRYKNSSRFTPVSTIISTQSATLSIVKLTSFAARSPWPSGNRLLPEVCHIWPSCANRRLVAIRLTAPRPLIMLLSAGCAMFGQHPRRS